MEIHFAEKDNSIDYALTSYPFCMNFCVILVCQTFVNNSAKALEAGYELPSIRESICAQDSRVYEWCCSSACGPQAMPAV